MIRDNLDELPDWPFPEGYGMRRMQPGDERLWEDIQRDAEPYAATRDGLFEQEFGDDPVEAWRRVFLLTSPKGCAVGTMGAWYDRSFLGKDYGRIHWVSVRPAFQGRGLAKAALASALRVLSRSHQRAYLSTQTKRVAAIAIYLGAGFHPHMTTEPDRVAWARIAATMRKSAHREQIAAAMETPL